VVDAGGQYVLPGFIDGHIHIEFSYLCSEELGRLLAPHGTAAIIADPHEIVNVCGLAGLDYMRAAAAASVLGVYFMAPSCVPSTPFEHAGAELDAAALSVPMDAEGVLGLGEFMNYPGVVNGDDPALDKLLLAYRKGKLIDDHSPGLGGMSLNAYAAARIHTDHECATVEELRERIARGMYVLFREGSACHDLRNLLAGVTARNSRRCVLCSDDYQPRDIFANGHIDHHLRICVEEGLDPMTAIQMATINGAECFRLHDRGALAPGFRADFSLTGGLKDFAISRVFIGGKPAAEDGRCRLPVTRVDDSPVRGSFHIRDFSEARLVLPLKSDWVHVIDVKPGGVVTSQGIAVVRRDSRGAFVNDPAGGVAKIAVVERHRKTGNVGLALIRGYGIWRGAIALSVAHDSHNIITVGTNDADMARAVERLVEMEGGVALVRDGAVLQEMPLPLGGIMSDRDGEWVDRKLVSLHECCFDALGVARTVEPIMTLCFMSLSVIPELKITDMGLFDVTKFEFIPIEAD
jgi:adenine deaminase